VKHRIAKSSIPKASFLAFSALFIGGCLFGGEGEEPTEILDPEKPDTTAVIDTTGNPDDTLKPNEDPIHLVAGVYRGDYGASGDSIALESEMVIGENGEYQFIGVQLNDAALLISGKYSISDNNDLALQDQHLAFSIGSGLFDSAEWTEVPPDTFFIRKVTATSFERYEPFPGTDIPRQLWVTYTKINFPELSSGNFDTEVTYEDSTGVWIYRTLLELKESGSYLRRDYENDFEYQQIAAEGWRHQGSFLVTDHHILRQWDDSTDAFVDLDQFSGEIYYRVKDAATSGFKMWYEPDFEFPEGNWVEYAKAE
jgi:hypothetical protein